MIAKTENLYQLELFPEMCAVDEPLNSTTFLDNMKLPLHRWYRYTAGFSGGWVGNLIEKEKRAGRTRVLDPFVGSGTVSIESMLHGVDSYGVEAHPYVYRIARAKVAWKDFDLDELISSCLDVLSCAKGKTVSRTVYPKLLEQCFPMETLQKLESLKIACNEIENEALRNFVWFVITSILRSTSPVGTAQWQYIQPRKTKSKVLDPYEAYAEKIADIKSDIIRVNARFGTNAIAKVLQDDARTLPQVPDKWADLVITSPPYANNYDYADAMRLEMLFWGEIDGWKDMQEKVASRLMRACTQHVSALKDVASDYLVSDLLAPIRDELQEKYRLLEMEREQHGGKKNYHRMIVAYFYDMAQVLRSLKRVASQICKMCFVIGDSAPYGIYIPVDDWLGRLALAAGFSRFSFEKLRDRNVKWKNRKHRIPLKEGRLWITN